MPRPPRSAILRAQSETWFRALSKISLIVPARYLIPSLQTVFLAGDIWPMFMPAIAIMLLIGAALFAMAARSTRKRIG